MKAQRLLASNRPRIGQGDTRLLKTLCLVVALLSLCIPSLRASSVVVDSVELQVLFPIGKSKLDPSLGDNSQRISTFLQRLRQAESDPSLRVGRVKVAGFASPDGSYTFNQRLSRERANTLAALIRNHLPDLPDSLLSIRHGGIDWEGLEKAVESSGMSNAHRVLYLLRHEPEFTYENGRQVRSRKQQLMNLDGGRTWRWMMQHLYPNLRSSASVVCYIEASQPKQEPEPIIEKEMVGVYDSVPMIEEINEPVDSLLTVADTIEALLPTYQRYPIAALRSNLLVPLLNVGIEVPVSKHWSVGADYYYPWIWPAKSNKNCFELIFVSAEARYWFKPNTNPELPEKNYLTGHSIGLYGAWGYYDIEHNWKGHQGHAWSVGLDYVYALPIAKGLFHLEFQFAVGIVWSRNAQPYKVYTDGGNLIREPGLHKNFFYLGPTKAGVSLVLPINRKVQLSTPLQP